ncbi:unnamed protein product, partial [marine sediment metagenome]
MKDEELPKGLWICPIDAQSAMHDDFDGAMAAKRQD